MYRDRSQKQHMVFRKGGIAVPAVVALLLSACTGAPATSPPASAPAEATTGEEPQAEAIEWRQNVLWGPQDIKTGFMEEFASRLEERTNGAITITQYPASALMPPGDAAKETSTGTLAIDANATQYYEPIVPLVQLTSLPFIYQVTELREIVLPGTRGREILDEVLAEANLKLLAFWDGGTSGLVASEPLVTVDSLEGKVLRISQQVPSDVLRSVGAEVVQMGGAEAVDAMQRGVVEGGTIEPTGIQSRGYDEFMTHWIDWKIAPIATVLMMNLDEWSALPSELQDIVWETAQEVEAEADAAVVAAQAGALEEAEAAGMTILQPDPGELEKLREIAAETIDTTVAEIEPQDLAEEFMSLIEENFAND